MKHKNREIVRYIRSLIIILGLLFGLSAFGQTQQGYVKTLGRPDKKGEPLSAVSVRVKGEHNPVLSKNDGKFEMILTGKKNGDAYTLQEVQKKGYELNDIGIIGCQYAYSDKVPLTIVMVSSAQLQADKQRIENNAYKVAEKNYKAKLDLLERKKEENAISEEQYRKELLDLQDKFEKYQLLIDGLAEHYAHVDYDELNDKEREVNICIENGELEQADSLIKKMFDPIDVLKRNKEALAQLNQQIFEANTIIDKANEDMATVLKQQEKDANYLYQLYTIALSRFDNDKARFYIETRAELDTTNVNWQNDAGMFINEYIADYNKALVYFQRGLSQSFEQYADSSTLVQATLYNNIGAVYANQGFYQDALENHSRALDIRQKRLDAEPSDLAITYNNIGGIMADMGNFPLAIEYYSKGLKIWKSVLGNTHPYVATSYNNLGVTYDKQGLYDEALECYSKAFGIMKDNPNLRMSAFAELHNNIGQVFYNVGNYRNALVYHGKATEFFLKLYGEIHPHVATSYNNIGLVYEKVGNFEKALQFYGASLNIRKTILGDNHIDVAFSYGNIGKVLSNLNLFSEAESYFNMALTLQLKLQSDKHPNLATLYDNIGLLMYYEGKNEEALEFYNKALKIQKEAFEKDNAEVAVTYNNFGAVYDNLGEYDMALAEYLKALKIKEGIFKKGHPDIADVYNNIGHVYHNKGDYQEAQVNYEKALEIYKNIYGEDHTDVAHVLINLGKLCDDKKEYEMALDYYNSALEILEKVFGTNNTSTATCYNNIGAVYLDLKDYSKALEFYEKGLNVRLKLLNPNHPDIASSYDNIGIVYHYQDQQEQALQFYEKALSIRKAVLPADHMDLAFSYNNIGGIYDNIGDFENAVSNYKAALEIWSKKVDDCHHLVSLCCYNIGLLYINNKMFSEGIGFMERALPGYIKNSGEMSIDVYGIYLYIANAYEQIGEYAIANDFLSKALIICHEIKGTDNTDYTTIVDHKKYLSDRLIASDKQEMSEYIYVASINEGGTAAINNGLTGEYVVLEYNDWNVMEDAILYDIIASTSNQPKAITFMKDNQIISYSYENTVGASFSLKKTTKDYKKRIIKTYKKWKNEHFK